MKVLVVNAGSSSLKYQLFDTSTEAVLAKGLCERIGIDGKITHKRPGKEKYFCETKIANHDEAIALANMLLELLYKLEAEYTAHASFIMNGPFEHRNLSQSSENMIKALSLRAEAKGGTDGGKSFQD